MCKICEKYIDKSSLKRSYTSQLIYVKKIEITDRGLIIHSSDDPYEGFRHPGFVLLEVTSNV